MTGDGTGVGTRGIRLGVVLASALVLSACSVLSGPAQETAPIDPGPGPFANDSEAFIDYPADAAPVPIDAIDFMKRWFAETRSLGFSEFVQTGEGTQTSTRSDNELRVWVDVASDGLLGPLEVGQLTIENRATTKEDAVYTEEIIPIFFLALGMEVPPELGLGDPEGLFDEPRTAVVTIDGTTVYLAANKWAIVLGVTG